MHRQAVRDERVFPPSEFVLKERKNSLSKGKNNRVSIGVVCVCVYMCSVMLNYVLYRCVCVELCSVMLYCVGVV